MITSLRNKQWNSSLENQTFLLMSSHVRKHGLSVRPGNKASIDILDDLHFKNKKKTHEQVNTENNADWIFNN